MPKTIHDSETGKHFLAILDENGQPKRTKNNLGVEQYLVGDEIQPPNHAPWVVRGSDGKRWYIKTDKRGKCRYKVPFRHRLASILVQWLIGESLENTADMSYKPNFSHPVPEDEMEYEQLNSRPFPEYLLEDKYETMMKGVRK